MKKLAATVTGLSPALLALISCADGIGPHDLLLTLDQASYVAGYVSGEGNYRQYGFTVLAQFHNRTAQDLYLVRCYPSSPIPTFDVELVGITDSWGSGYSPNWACVGHDQQIRVAAGEARVDTLHLRGPNAFNGYTGEPYGVMSGRMRITYQVQDCRGEAGTCELPRPYGLSPVFTVTQSPD
jgi:hypothetical protein